MINEKQEIEFSEGDDEDYVTSAFSDKDIFGSVKYNSIEYIKQDNTGQKVLDGWKILEEIETGSFSKVKRIEKNGIFQAFKIYNKLVLENQRMLDYDTMEWTNNLKKMVSEIEIWSQLNDHPNICKLYEVYEAEGKEKVYLRTELGEYGTLAKFDSKKRLYSPNPEIHKFAQEKKYSEI